MKDATRLTSATLGRSPSRRSVNTPVERGSTVLFERADKLYDDDIKPTYGTDGLSTQVELCRMIAELEGAQESFILPSGLAALTLPIFACLQAGDEILAVNSCYAPVRRFLDTQLKRYGVTARYYDPALSADEVIALATPATKMIYVESPGSLTFDIQDIPAIARAAGIIVDWEDLHALSDAVPLIARVYPNGSGDVNDFHHAGGMGFVIRELLGAGLLHGDIMTVAGETLADQAKEPAMEGEA